MSGPYVRFQLARAFVTATTHGDDDVRSRAVNRVEAWLRVLDNVDSGLVEVGSRQPVADLPTWVTLEVVRGGFATGRPSAGGDLVPEELALAEELGIAARRELLFAHHLTDTGLETLWSHLDSGAYRIDVPESAALLVVAWLLRADRVDTAAAVVEQLLPFADRLRFTPRAAPARREPLEHVHRLDARAARAVLDHRREKPQVEAQREALAVWAPFTDRVVGVWQTRLTDVGLDDPADPAAWRGRAAALLAEYLTLVREHPRCTKHRRPNETLALLLAATGDELSGRSIPPRRRGLLAARLRAATAAHGAPGSVRLSERRRDEETVWRSPSHAQLAHVAARRLDDVPADEGHPDPAAFAHPVTTDEADVDSAAGTAMPPVVVRTLALARSAPVETLIASGIVPSGEVLAELVPGVSATVVAESYPDAALGQLMGRHHVAFSRRRSLLLLDLQQQVRDEELPWVQAVSPFRRDTTDAALATARCLGGLALDHFPGRIVPNPLTSELARLLRVAGVDVPLTEELAADIFMGRFSPKFATAARLAARLTFDSVYAAYHDLDQVAAAVPPPATAPRRPWWKRATPVAEVDWFSPLCQRRAGADGASGGWVAHNGTVIEQAQILTTHNLAGLVELGVVPTRPWRDLADDGWQATRAWLDLARTQSRPLGAVKNAAYAWRQTVFFLGRTAPADVDDWLVRAGADAEGSAVLGQIVGGLAHVARGGRFGSDGRCPGGRRFLGWTVGPHWVLDRA